MAIYEGEFDPKVIGWRLGRAESALKELDVWQRKADRDLQTTDDRFKNLTEDMHALTNELRSVKTLLVRFSFSVSLAAVTFAITVLAATGKI